MLGTTIDDPLGIEGAPGQSDGLGLLDVQTVLTSEKCLMTTKGQLSLNGKSAKVFGYEIHVGRSQVKETQPFVMHDGQPEGALSPCNQILGSYLHGLLDSEEALQLICEWANDVEVSVRNFDQMKEEAINRIADAIETHLDLTLLGM